MPTNTYSPADVIVTFHGKRITGFADDTFVEADFTSDSFTLHVGADGETARSANADESGEIKLVLLQTSQGNDILNAEHALDRATKRNTGPVLVKDARGATLITGSEAYLKRGAAVSFGKEVTGREWTIVVPKMACKVGGNA